MIVIVFVFCAELVPFVGAWFGFVCDVEAWRGAHGGVVWVWCCVFFHSCGTVQADVTGGTHIRGVQAV